MGRLEGFRPREGVLVIDALFGAGLAKPLAGASAAAAGACREARAFVVAIDLPSGISGATGKPLGPAFEAALTVTFFRRKPGHLLYPGRAHCGELVVADIGIPAAVLDEIVPATFENAPSLWRALLPQPAIDAHKYARGHAAVFSGGPSHSGAARLSALGAARIGAGAVTLLSPANALAVNAGHLTSIMLARADEPADAVEFIGSRKVAAAVIGPGFGVGERLRGTVEALLGGSDGNNGSLNGLVLDADAITSFAERPDALFSRAEGAPALVLTPHEGEFGRLFPDLAEDGGLSKLDKARAAAKQASAVLVYKGPDTVIAAPDGRSAINTNGTPWLATAGSGDVLAGMIAGLLAQKMPAWEAACAAVWIHAEAAGRFGPGLIAEDLPVLLPPVLHELFGSTL
jgi:ADP-dependent NAD(P)H-hydrate dehydratase / NAD(P)H-hydrate epimerase